MILTNWHTRASKLSALPGQRSQIVTVYERGFNGATGCAIRVHTYDNNKWVYKIKLPTFIKHDYCKKENHYYWSRISNSNVAKSGHISYSEPIETKELALFLADLKAVELGYKINDAFESNSKVCVA